MLISSFANSLKSLALTEKIVMEIKLETNKVFLDRKGIESRNWIYYKYIIYFLISFPLLFFCWYYLGCFCAVYKNTQIYLLKDSLISFGITLLYPIFLYLVPGIFRIPALRSEKKNKETMFKFSKIIQSI